MWSKELQTGSWIDCLNAIEKEISSLKRILHRGPHQSEFTEKLSSHEAKNRFGVIWHYAGRAVKDLERV